MPDPNKSIRDLGWANDQPELDRRFAQCRAEKHDIEERNLDPSGHGYNHLCICQTCGYSFHFDSSG